MVIIFVSLTITTLIVVLGVQVFYILKEVRTAMEKVNQMLDDGTKVSSAMTNTVEGATGVVNGLVSGLSFISNLTSKLQKKRRHSDD